MGEGSDSSHGPGGPRSLVDMAYSLRCPCGTNITAPDEEFVGAVQGHLAAEHEGRTYTEDEIMTFATKVPERRS